MLPLVSSTIPRLTGTRSLLKCVIGCGSSSWKTRKSSLPQPRHEAAGLIGDRGGDVDQLDAAAETERLRIALRLRLLRASIARSRPRPSGCALMTSVAAAQAATAKSLIGFMADPLVRFEPDYRSPPGPPARVCRRARSRGRPRARKPMRYRETTPVTGHGDDKRRLVAGRERREVERRPAAGQERAVGPERERRRHDARQRRARARVLHEPGDGQASAPAAGAGATSARAARAPRPPASAPRRAQRQAPVCAPLDDAIPKPIATTTAASAPITASAPAPRRGLILSANRSPKPTTRARPGGSPDRRGAAAAWRAGRWRAGRSARRSPRPPPERSQRTAAGATGAAAMADMLPGPRRALPNACGRRRPASATTIARPAAIASEIAVTAIRRVSIGVISA